MARKAKVIRETWTKHYEISTGEKHEATLTMTPREECPGEESLWDMLTGLKVNGKTERHSDDRFTEATLKVERRRTGLIREGFSLTTKEVRV